MNSIQLIHIDLHRNEPLSAKTGRNTSVQKYRLMSTCAIRTGRPGPKHFALSHISALFPSTVGNSITYSVRNSQDIETWAHLEKSLRNRLFR